MRHRARWRLAALVVLACGVSAFPVAAQDGAAVDLGQAGSDPLGQGWSGTDAGDGVVLRWEVVDELPVRSARPEFRSGDELLGYPVRDGDQLVLRVPNAQMAELVDLSVWLGTTRLDGPTPDRPVANRSDGAELFTRARPPVLADDPGAPGPYDTETLSYDLAPLPHRGYAAPMEVVGEVIAPVGAPGARPFVLFLHGRHSTCYSGGPDGLTALAWPCPDPFVALPSYQGYRYAAELLASQGYVTVSISANAVNAQDEGEVDSGARARSRLVRHHLGLWADWAADGTDPWGGRFEGRVDLSRTVLVGHSRGGEGVERAAVDSRRRDPWRIRGLVPIGPTAFGRQQTAGIHTAVLLPYCDGDVSDLQGQTYVDNSRDLVAEDPSLRASVLIMGANHNYFNTEWTPGQAVAPAEDDWFYSAAFDDPTCGPSSPRRLAGEDQQAAGATYIAALAAVAVEGDVNAARLLDGTDVRAASAGPARVFTHALGGRREPVLLPSDRTRLSATEASARVCRGYLQGDVGVVSECAPSVTLERQPHFLPMGGGDLLPAPAALEVAWTRAGGSARASFAPRDLGGGGSLDLRVAVEPESGPARFGLRLVDAAGAVADLPGSFRLTPFPGTRSPIGKAWGVTVRSSLRGLTGVDLGRVVGIEVVPRSDTGKIWILDVHRRRAGLDRSRNVFLPQLSIGNTSVVEGSTARVVRVPLRVRGRGRQAGVLGVQIYDATGVPVYDEVRLRPGQRRAALKVMVPGDDAYAQNLGSFQFLIGAQRGLTTGSYTGSLQIIEDDPPPVLTLSLSPNPVTEGETVTLTLTSSQPLANGFFVTVGLIPPEGGGPSLDTDDVPAEWLLAATGLPEVPDPPVPLGDAVFGFIEVPPGATEGFATMPLAADGVVEGDEKITFRIDFEGDPTSQAPLTAELVVQDA